MSATNTSLRVIEWATQSLEGLGFPPQGDVCEAEALAHPSVELIQVLGQLTALTSARLRLISPVKDDCFVGTGTIIMAASIGIMNIPNISRTLLQAVPVAKTLIEWVARYGLLAPAQKFLPEDIKDDYRQLSPLTSLLDRPVLGQETAAISYAQQFIDYPDARLALTLHVASPTDDTKIRDWRTELLSSLRLGTKDEQKFVLDVYEAMMIHHQQEAIAQAHAAYAVLTDPVVARDEAQLKDALSIADNWKPLWAIERENLDALRARRYLSYAYREGIKLFNLSRRLRGGTL
jgi:hypothetical protein